MANTYSMEDVLDFLSHASDRGLMPASTATALAVAVRNVLGVLTEDERGDLGSLDMAAVIKRFTNKRARDFSPTSLKEYGRRVQRAIDLYRQWSSDPANFSIKTRATNAGKKRQRNGSEATSPAPAPEWRAIDSLEPYQSPSTPMSLPLSGGYATSIPIRTDWVVTVSNLPPDLTPAEAERLAKFIRLLSVE